MAGGQVFDVFLSHHSADKPAVELLARRLEDEAGLHPFLDKWHLTPGNPWQEELERALELSRACAVFIGPSEIGPWENEEMRSALDDRVKLPEFRVVPVLLPGATMPERGGLPRFLSRLNWVDFRRPDGIHDAEAFRRLVAGVRGIPPGRDDTDAPIASTFICPYRGLEVFEEAHASWFFGREAVTQHLVEAVRGTRFLAVVGPSGSGKSSVVRAGLLPALRTGALPSSDHWRYLVSKPGAHPLQELALQLVHVKGDGAPERVLSVLHSLEADERALHLQVRLSLADQSGEGRCCLLIDQFEEVFTMCPDEAERVRFIELLRYAATIGRGQTIIIITLRADFVAQAATYTPLAELLSAHQFLLSPMDEEDLRLAIEEPARQAGLRWEAGLVEAILQDMGREPGALPLMEHALLQLWEKRRADNVMTLQAYGEIGGVQGALAKRAEEVFAALPPEQQQQARPLLLRLTQPGEGAEDTRRRAAMSELILNAGDREPVEGVVRALTDARLLTTSGEGPAGEQTVDVSHEALIRGWPRLRGWIDDDRAGLRVHRRLTEAAQEWQRLHRDVSVLYRGARLAEVMEWRERNEGVLNAVERAFLEASVRLQTKERRRRRLRVAGSVFALVAVISSSGWAWLQSQLVVLQRDVEKIREYEQLRQQLKRDAKMELLTQPVDSTVLQEALVSKLARLQGHRGPITRLAFSPNKALMVTASTDGTVRVWDITTEREVAILEHGAPVYDIEFTPDGRLIMTGGENGTVRAWDTTTGQQSAILIHDSSPIINIAVSPNTRFLATTAARGESVTVWEVTNGKIVASLSGHTDQVTDLVFSPDGLRLVTASMDHTARVWDVTTGREVASLSGHTDAVDRVAFTSDGRFIITAGTDGTRIWEASTGKLYSQRTR